MQNKKQIRRVRRPAYPTNLNQNAFTLVELIVVITILAILGTIAFISLQGYSAQARDSKRLSDISNIKKSLELFSLNSGKYPEPDDYNTVSYSGEIIWYQGTVGNQVSTNLSRNLNEKPVDPTTGEEYIYSRTYAGTEYELLGLYESDLISLFPVLVNAASLDFPKIEGNYNGLYAKTSNFYIPTPSIVNGNVWGNIDFAEDETLIESQVVTGGDNIPGESTGGLDITLSVYEGAITVNSTEEEKIELVEAIQAAYSGSQLANETIYSDILSKTSTGEMEDFVDVVVLNKTEYVSMDSEVIINNSCDESTKPLDNNHISYQEGTPTEENQSYIENVENCGYSCEEGYEYSVGDNTCMLSECSGSIIINATSNSTSQSYGIAWNYNLTPGDCTFACNSNYSWDGNSCEADTQSCTIANGVGIQTWLGSSWDTCQVVECGIDYYNLGNNMCSAVGIGYYSDSTSTGRIACTNKPANNSQYTTDGNGSNSCTWECIDGYSGLNCTIVPLTGWRALDSNCDEEDIVLGTQTWAGCNSTLGDGIERGQLISDMGTDNYNGESNTCYDYNGNNTATCTVGSLEMKSNTKANTWYTGTNTNSDSEYSNIWGKLYTWADSSSACPSGRHFPSDNDWKNLETYLNGGVDCRGTTVGLACDGLGWSSANGTKSRSLTNALKIPLSGSNWFFDKSQFVYRGYMGQFWTSDKHAIYIYWYSSEIFFGTTSTDFGVGFSVRCIKD